MGINLPDLQRTLIVIEQFERSPLDLEGKRAAQLLHKKRRPRRRRRRRQRTTNTSGSEEEDDDGGKVARKARERENYMSAQFIEDSDEEYGRDIEGFFEREAALRSVPHSRPSTALVISARCDRRAPRSAAVAWYYPRRRYGRQRQAGSTWA